MKVLILGGCGDMALVALEALASEEGVKRVTIADLNEDKARSIASEMGDRFIATRVDAMNHGEVVAIMKAHDVTLCFVGPFYIFEKRLAQAAIEAGVPYVSISDDYDAYLDVITLEEAAAKKGVKILTGFGNSPGITQVLAKKGYQSMDDPRKINVHWAAGPNEAVGPANIKHVLHILSGETLQWIGGREVAVKTGTGKKMVDFPEPIGTIPAVYTGHAESVSLPRNLPGLEEVTLHGGVNPPWIFSLAYLLGKMGLTTTHARRERLTRMLVPLLGLFAATGPDRSVFRIDVYGNDKGKPVHRYYTGVGHIAFITSIPAVTAAMWLLKGVWDDLPGGVYSAERICDPDPFLDELARRGVELHYHE